MIVKKIAYSYPIPVLAGHHNKPAYAARYGVAVTLVFICTGMLLVNDAFAKRHERYLYQFEVLLSPGDANDGKAKQ